MIKRLIFAIALLCSVATAGAQIAFSDDERKELREYIPLLKKADDFQKKVDDFLSGASRRLGISGADDSSATSAFSSEEKAEFEAEKRRPAEPMQSKEEARKELLVELRIAKSQQRAYLASARQKVKVLVGHYVNSCKSALAVKNEPEAKLQCRLAEQQIAECKREVEPRVEKIAARQTARFKSEFGDEGDFSALRMFCDIEVRGFENPNTLLQQAQLNLNDTSCYSHLYRFDESLKTGKLDNRMKTDDDSPQAYLAFIKRMCSTDIGLLAQKHWETAPEIPKPPSGPVLLSRQSAGSQVFQQARVDAEEYARDRPFREARERAAAEQAAVARAADQESFNNGLAIFGAVVGALADAQQARNAANSASAASAALQNRQRTQIPEAVVYGSNTNRSNTEVQARPGAVASVSNSGTSNTRLAGDCLIAVKKTSGGIDLKNTCGYAVEIGWCVIGHDCKNGDWGYSNQLSLGAGRTWPIFGSINRVVNFGACTPINTNVISTSRTEYSCGG